MTLEQIQSFIRQVLTFFGGILVTYGYFDQGTATQLVGALSTLVSIAWSWYSHTPASPSKVVENYKEE